MAVLPHYLLRLSGTLFGGPQTWSVGVRYRSATGGDPSSIADVQTRLESWRDAVRALNGSNILPLDLLGIMSSATRITGLRASSVGADGKETAVAVVEGAPLAIGNQGPIHPGQVAVCFSLDGDHPGASNRGRVYLPGLGIAMGQNGRILTQDCLTFAGLFAGFLHDAGNAGASAIAPGLAPVVISSRKGTAAPITKVRVGDRFDIQRRRADKQTEGYSIAPIPS